MTCLFLFFSAIIITLAGATNLVEEEKFHKDDQHFQEVYECFMEKYRCPNERFTEVKSKYLPK